jgi:hypothetical protein
LEDHTTPNLYRELAKAQKSDHATSARRTKTPRDKSRTVQAHQKGKSQERCAEEEATHGQDDKHEVDRGDRLRCAGFSLADLRIRRAEFFPAIADQRLHSSQRKTNQEENGQGSNKFGGKIEFVTTRSTVSNQGEW